MVDPDHLVKIGFRARSPIEEHGGSECGSADFTRAVDEARPDRFDDFGVDHFETTAGGRSQGG